MNVIEATIDNTTFRIDYEYDITDESLCHLRKLIKYFNNFNQDDVLVWVPGADDDECEFGVYPDPDADYSQSGEGYGKTIILTRGREADTAFGEDWDKEHISQAAVSWNISEEEYQTTIAEFYSNVESNRQERIAAGF